MRQLYTSVIGWKPQDPRTYIEHSPFSRTQPHNNEVRHHTIDKPSDNPSKFRPSYFPGDIPPEFVNDAEAMYIPDANPEQQDRITKALRIIGIEPNNNENMNILNINISNPTLNFEKVKDFLTNISSSDKLTPSMRRTVAEAFKTLEYLKNSQTIA